MSVVELNPQQREEIAASALSGGGSGDPRVAVKVAQFRNNFRIPRRVWGEVSGVSQTSLYRVEKGQRDFSIHSLPNAILGGRKLVKQLHPYRVREYDAWARELVEIVAVVESEKAAHKKERIRERRKTGEPRVGSVFGRVGGIPAGDAKGR